MIVFKTCLLHTGWQLSSCAVHVLKCLYLEVLVVSVQLLTQYACMTGLSV